MSPSFWIAPLKGRTKVVASQKLVAVGKLQTYNSRTREPGSEKKWLRSLKESSERQKIKKMRQRCNIRKTES